MASMRISAWRKVQSEVKVRGSTSADNKQNPLLSHGGLSAHSYTAFGLTTFFAGSRRNSRARTRSSEGRSSSTGSQVEVDELDKIVGRSRRARQDCRSKSTSSTGSQVEVDELDQIAG